MSAGVRRLHVEKNSHHRKSTLASRNGETKRRRPLDAYRRARGSPPLYCSRPCRPFSRRALPHGRSSSTKSRRKQRAVAGTRTEKGQARTKLNERDGRARGRNSGSSSKMVEERKRVGKRDERGQKRERGRQFRRRPSRGSQYLKKIGGE